MVKLGVTCTVGVTLAVVVMIMASGRIISELKKPQQHKSDDEKVDLSVLQ